MAFRKTKIEPTQSITNYQLKQQATQDKSVIRREFDLSEEYDSVVAVFVGDWHIGTVDFDLEGAINVLEYTLRTPNAVMFCLGDMLNTAILNSVSDMFEDIAYPQEQWQLFVDLFHQVAEQNKLAVLHTGNHERRVTKQTGLDPVLQAAVAIDEKDAHAPFHAETTIKIKCTQSPTGYFEIPLVTHHGDGGNPELFSDINKDTLVNAMGHTHNFQVWNKTLLTHDHVSNKHIKKEELEIMIAANGGGLYGNAKGWKKIHKVPYLALDLTTTLNPRYDYYKNSDYTEPLIVLASRSFNILSKANTADKEELIKVAERQIEKNKKATQIKILAKMQEIIELLENYGLEATEDVKRAITKKIIASAKNKPQTKSQTLSPEKFTDEDDLER